MADEKARKARALQQTIDQHDAETEGDPESDARESHALHFHARDAADRGAKRDKERPQKIDREEGCHRRRFRSAAGFSSRACAARSSAFRALSR